MINGLHVPFRFRGAMQPDAPETLRAGGRTTPSTSAPVHGTAACQRRVLLPDGWGRAGGRVLSCRRAYSAL